MEAKSETCQLNIGKSVYAVNTPLGAAELGRIKAVIDDACGDITAKSMKQEDILMLACLKLAYTLDRVSQKLFVLLSDLEQ